MLFACALASPAAAQGDDVEIVAHVLQPQPSEPALDRIKAPDGFEVSVFAEDLINPRMMVVRDDGTVYVSRRDVGDVVMLKDTDGDGRADRRQTVLSRPNLHGLAIDGDTMYLATIKEVYKAEIDADGTLSDPIRIIDDLPDAGQHPNRTVVVGPDDMLYIQAGSTCNACAENNPENATILQAKPDGSSRKVFASGLRNTIGFAFEPGTGVLYGADHGIDWLGDDEQHEEFNRIKEGKRYGWPYIYADGKQNPADEPPKGISMDQWARMSEEPVLLYTPHAAPMQMAFYQGTGFPEEYQGDALIAMRGSWNRKPPSGYEIVRVDFENGEPKAIEPFVTGFAWQDGDAWRQMGRLCGLAVMPDGSMLFSDDENGVVYRVAYTGGGTEAEASPTQNRAKADTNAAATPQETPQKLALAILEGDGASNGLDVTSSAFEDGAKIPPTFAQVGQDISPPLAWKAGPKGTRSYAVLLEDPDAPEPTPYVHWLAWNIPADVTSLREGVPGTPKLQLPDGMVQGMNSKGTTGYVGMKPPPGETHTYHAQVLALDTVLDVPPGGGRKQVLDALEGHVLATGDLAGTFSSP